MFEIKVHCKAPEQMKTLNFWCNFLVGTHWRKFGDNAEIVLKRVENNYGKIGCLCEAFNNKYSLMGKVVRDFPIGYSPFGDSTNIETITKYGFNLVPDAIQSGRGWGPDSDDSYYHKMNNLEWGDPFLRRVDHAYVLDGLSCYGRPNDPIALFSLGIPIGRVVSIKGLVIGNESGPNYSYELVYK